MESTILGFVIAFVVGVLVGRSSLRSRSDRLEAQLRQSERDASAQRGKIDELISENNELTDLYNAVILASAKPQKRASKAKEVKAVKSSNPTKTPPTVASLKPRAGKPLTPMQPAAAQPVVVTRTSTLGAGVRAIDNWFEKTDWLANEDLDLKTRINMGESVATIAVALGIDQTGSAVGEHAGRIGRGAVALRLDDVALFLERWSLSTPERARQSLKFLSSPLWRAYTSTYVEGYRLLGGWLDEVPVGAERTERFRRLLDEPLVPSSLRAA